MTTARTIRTIAATIAVAACAGDATAPRAAREDILLPVETADLALSAVPDQASLPGLLYERSTSDPKTVSGGDRKSGGGEGKGTCAYNTTTNRLLCTVVTGGLTTVTSYSFLDASGKPQQASDKNTATINAQVSVKGFAVKRDGDTTIVTRTSELTETGFLSDKRTSNGSETGTEIRTLGGEKGVMKATESYTTKTVNVVVKNVAASREAKDPAASSEAKTVDNWPLSGTVSRSSTVTSTLVGSTETHTHTSSQTTTFNGTSTVTTVVVRDGVTQTCTQDLRTGKVICPQSDGTVVRPKTRRISYTPSVFP